MTLPVILRPEAEWDVQAAFAEYEAIRPGLGKRFLMRVRQVLERIEFMPEIYGTIWEDVRSARLKKFRHVVYYLVSREMVEVLAVLHGARDASTWQSRL